MTRHLFFSFFFFSLQVKGEIGNLHLALSSELDSDLIRICSEPQAEGAAATQGVLFCSGL